MITAKSPQVDLLHGVASQDFSFDTGDVAKKPGGLTVQLERDVADRFSEWARRNSHDKKGVLSQMLEWFLLQPTSLQRFVLGQDLGDLASATAMQFRHIAATIEHQALDAPKVVESSAPALVDEVAPSGDEPHLEQHVGGRRKAKTVRR